MLSALPMKSRRFIAIFAGFVSMMSIACFPWLTEDFRVPRELRAEQPLVRIRFTNRTGQDFQQVSVGRRNFPPLRHGAVSDYHYFAGVYVDYPDKSMSVQAQTLDRPMDRVVGCGNTPVDLLSSGNYTCVLFSPDTQHPNLLYAHVQRD